MTIQRGERIPEITLNRIRQGVEKVDTPTLFQAHKVVLFGVPGAFTPTCSERHLPGFIKHFDEFRKRGVEVYCVAVNDPFVMKAWGESLHVPDGLQLLADGSGDLTRAMGLDIDLSGNGMGLRSRRYALYAVDGVVQDIWVEAPGEFKVSSAEQVLQQIPA